MKKIALCLSTVVVLALSACSSQNDSRSDQNEPSGKWVLDLSNLSLQVTDESPEELDLGATSATVRELTEVITLRNSTADSADLAVVVSGAGYKVKLNRCGTSIKGR